MRYFLVFSFAIIFFIGTSITQAQQTTSADRYVGYHSIQDTYLYIDSIAKAYPNIVYVDTIGYSQANENPIIALRISDNPEIDEDEPCVMYDGLHHAREPISMETCLHILDYLVSNYSLDNGLTNLIDETEIWIIPMINPDGWDYCYEKELDYPYWRKNKRDNNEDGRFLPTVDGVDVNRNYDHNWAIGGSGDFNSITYRGASAFSESESRAKQFLALREKPVISLSYHTYGEIVIFSWSETPRAPDQELIEDIATEVASRIPSITGQGSYNPSVSNCQNGFSRCWMYAVAGSIEFTVECAKEFIPYGDVAQQIARDNINGALYILERVHGSGMQIYVNDAVTLEPIVANVSIVEINEFGLTPRKTDSIFGRFDRLLDSGTYTLLVEAEGYSAQTRSDIMVGGGNKTLVQVFLNPESLSDRELDLAKTEGKILVNKIYPNPFKESFTMEYTLYEDTPVKVSLFDITGRQIEIIVSQDQNKGSHSVKWETRNSDQDLSSGFYLLAIQTRSTRHTQKIWMIK